MAGKHSQKGSNAPLVILIVVAVIVVGAIVGGAIFLMNGGLSIFNKQETTAPVTTEVTASEAVPTTQADQAQTTAPAETKAQTEATTAADEGVHTEDTPIDIAVPTDPGVEVSYFNATFIPNGDVDDNLTGGKATLREVFGSGYSDGVLSFNEDGTFKDTLISSESNRGAYVVQDKTIHATYTNDKNMRIEVTEWDGGTPSKFNIQYGDYTVYFG
ncbi:MAG: hypothetical protein IIV15_00430 [Ruminococcus sp.]|nr:hypothetical protein [Ruminococcus sp.]